jgi:predicted PurR-regulated permease PerM
MKNNKTPPEASPGEEPLRRTELHVPVATIVKVLLTALLVWATLQLVPELLLFVLAVLAAVTLSPVVARIERWGVSRTVAVAIVAIAIVGVASAFVALVIPPLTSQISMLADNYRSYRAGVDRQLSPDYPFLKRVVLQILDLPSSPEVAASLKRPLAWGRVAVVGLTGVVLGIVLVIYLLVDGKKTYAWLLAYVPRRHRAKMAETVPEVSEVVIAYVQSQVLTSVLYAVYAFAALTLLKVPAALPLSLLAAICDVIPVLGVIVSTVPAVLLALTVSPVTAGAVLVLYALYHVFENYLIIPKVYGRRLRLSGLAVLATLIVGGTLYGIAGAVLALPIVAAYPIIERVWLQDRLSDEVLRDHSALEAAAEAGTSEHAVEKVLRGERHGLKSRRG